MTAWICATCGVQYAETERPPQTCIICSDERQYVPETGQRWITLAELQGEGHGIVPAEVEPGLTALPVQPRVGIGQRTLLVHGPAGNLLWDPTGFIDAAGIEIVRSLGGIGAVSASHPHMYGVMVEWSRAFGGVPVYVPEADREWVTRPDPAIQFWKDECEALPGLTLVRCGGHFPGSAAVYWPAGAEGRGAMLAGDTVMVAGDHRWVSFMRSFPNMLPMSGNAVRTIADRLAPYDYDRLYDNFGGVVPAGAKDAVDRSARRYAAWVSGEMDHLI